MASLSFYTATTTPGSRPQVLPRFPARARKPTSTSRLQARCEQGGNTTDTSRSTGGDDKKNSSNGASSSSPLRLDRRNVLLGSLGGGLYGAASLALLGKERGAAFGAPITIPDLTACHTATASSVGDVECCPPYSDISTAIDFEPPSASKPLRIRKPAHLLQDEEVEKYNEAYRLMRALPDDDPRSLKQQADVHCQYCNGAYYQTDTTTVLQVHYNWFFLPWHRLYLHFHERILGSLIGDDSFALPFWNWDNNKAGMMLPSFFTSDTTSALYNPNRNLNHYAPAIIDFEYAWGDASPSTDEEIAALINKNLLQVQKAFTESLTSPDLFMGGALSAGEVVNSAGSIESIHNGAHLWVGPDESPYMDMGNFYSAGRDPVFYCHHSNVDRMWSIYREKRGHKSEFGSDWLDSEFLFADENRQLVKCKVSDTLSTLDLKYVYMDVPRPWDEKSVRKKVLKAKAAKARKTTLEDVSEFGSSSRTLDSTIRALVTRPATSRSKSDKEEAAEVLIISSVVTPVTSPSRFDVYVNIPTESNQVSSDLGELAGCFIHVPHHVESTDDSSESTTHESTFKVGITGLVEDLEADAFEKLVVSLVPRFGDVTVGGIEIQLLETDSSSSDE
ncbi:hypothetical protein ACLOJK_041645 [Asimina triloba]